MILRKLAIVCLAILLGQSSSAWAEPVVSGITADSGGQTLSAETRLFWSVLVAVTGGLLLLIGGDLYRQVKALLVKLIAMVGLHVRAPWGDWGQWVSLPHVVGLVIPKRVGVANLLKGRLGYLMKANAVDNRKGESSGDLFCVSRDDTKVGTWKIEPADLDRNKIKLSVFLDKLPPETFVLEPTE